MAVVGEKQMAVDKAEALVAAPPLMSSPAWSVRRQKLCVGVGVTDRASECIRSRAPTAAAA
jgi:hypothetical protein